MKPSKKKSRKNFWNDPEFKKKVASLIEKGILLKGIDALLRALNKDVKEPEDAITRKALESHVEKFIWTSERLKLVKDFVRLGQNLDGVYKQLNFLTRDMIDKEAKKLRGHSVLHKEFQAPSQAGVNRLMVNEEIESGEPVKLPQGTRKNPYVVPVKDPGEFYLQTLPAPWIGSKYNQVFDENLARNTLIWAEQKGADCVLLPGGLFFMELKRSSGAGLMTHRARMSGYNFNPEVIAREYRAEAVRIRKNRKPNEAVFETLRERFANLVLGYAKIVTDKDGKRIFSGPLLITFSRGEEELQDAAAEAEASYITVCKRNDLEVQKKAKLAQLAYELKARGNSSFAAQLRAEIADLTSNLARTRVTNFSPEDRQFYAERVRSYMIGRYEKFVPGAKVIAQGTTVIKMGDELIEAKQDRDEHPTDNLLHTFLLDESGRRTLDKTLPDIQLLFSSYSLQQRWGVAERYDNKERTSTHIFQLPVAVDKGVIEAQTRDVIRKGSPFERLLRDPHFEPSVFALRYLAGVNGRDMVIPENLSIEMLTKLQAHQRANGEVKYMYFAVRGDNHVSHRWKHFFFDKKNGQWLGLESAFAELMRRFYLARGKDVPIHGEFGLGDDLQSHNFNTQNQPHNRSRIYADIEREFRATRRAAQDAGTKEEALAKLDEIHDEALSQLRHSGQDWPQRQFEEFVKTVIQPNADYYLSILRRGKEAGVKFTGVGPAFSGEEETRDIGNITCLGGDHFGWTVFGLLVESGLYVYLLRSELAKLAKGEFSDKELEQMVKAPVWGNKPCGIGVVSAPDGYEWNVYLRHEPAEVGGKNGDRMLPAVKNALARGDFSGIFGGKRGLYLSGGIHRYFWVHGRMIDHISNASGTDADPYSEKGWSPNNTGMLVVGLPAKGPEYGPIRVIPFNHDLVRELLLNPVNEFDFDKVFEDAL